MRSLTTRMRRAAAFLFLIVCLSIAATAATRVSHTVTIADPNATTLHVTTIITDVSQTQLEVGVPDWTPGYYTTEDFARNISRLAFTDQSGRQLYHRKFHDSVWMLNTAGASSVKIDFDYTANQLDLNKSLITPTYAILNGTNFFFYVKGHTLDTAETVTFKLPAGWRIATGLAPTSDPATFEAENYDVLVDSPAVVGEFDLVTLPLRGVPHHLVVAPKGVLAEADLQKLAADGLKVIDAHTTMFGEIPYKQYITFNVFAERGIGGLEHLNSYLGILPKAAARSEAIPDLVNLTSHEFFHAFNVKRIRPAEMWPYRYNERNYTHLLWVSEGITDYYTMRGLLRAGLIKPEDYLQARGNLLGGVQSDEAARYISVEEASINTWLGGIGGGNQPFTVDYYSRGNVLGLLLDLSIRHDTQGAATLDDVMRALYTNFYKKNRGFTTEDLVQTINRLTKKDYHAFFEKYVGGTEALPYTEVLSYAGLQLDETKNKVPRMGISTDNDKKITALVPGGAAEGAGVRVGDVLVSIGEIKVSDPDWSATFRKTYASRIGETIILSVQREGKPVSINLKLGEAEISSWKVSRLSVLTKEQQNILDTWLNGK
ncbi:MAG: PDZ domain-containing protein [Pyrinomonadaceae bacterium]